ncbi:MAG: right-handed parallel beta-helix repeat-containing protein [Ardenticatenia bacterium]|nr:right-handed parallel beta-helix repeat-containing protein [Ardenticatenia bacterium]
MRSRPIVVIGPAIAAFLSTVVLLWGVTSLAHSAPTATGLFAAPTGSGNACTQSAPCNLQTALSQADDGDTLYLAGGTYTGTGPAVITVTKSITLAGGWNGLTGALVRDPATYVSRLDGETSRRVVLITGTATVVLDGLTIVNGQAAGLGGNTPSDPDSGGGIYVAPGGPMTLTVVNSTIMSNTASTDITVPSSGGGLFAGEDTALTMITSRFVSNTARWGGGMRTVNADRVTVHGSEFISNAAQYGGGIYLLSGQGYVVEMNTFRGNVADYGGGVFISSPNDHLLRRNMFQGNVALQGGGLRISVGSSVTLRDNVFLENRATLGGGIHAAYTKKLVLENTVLAANEATLGGGGLHAFKTPDVRVLHASVVDNTGSGAGKGILVDDGSTVTVTNTLVAKHVVGVEASADTTVTLQATLWGNGIWANGTNVSGTVVSTQAITGDPAFQDPAAHDYRLTSGSAAVDAGIPTGVSFDFEGTPRPVGSTPDIGADEFAASVVYLPTIMR